MRNMDQAMDMWIMPRMVGWKAADIALVFLMWAVMMTAMMLPSALPVIMLVAKVSAGTEASHRIVGPTGAFAAGYILAWCVFSLAATLLQWGLLEAALVTPMMESASLMLSSTILIAAGLYQFTPLKNTCLRQCQSPLGVVMQVTSSPRRALNTGFRHGLHCLGCCWALMAILFVTGVMNILWIVLLAIYVLIEKTMPRQRWIAPAAGAALIGWGLWLWIRGL
jgi:predicted metal-binding membrane protein